MKPISGQATVEFALASLLFFTLVLGTIDFGRAIYVASTLQNAVREGGRVAKVQPANSTAIRNAVISFSPGLGLTSSNVTVQCSSSCEVGNRVTVAAQLPFSVVAQKLFNVPSITLNASTQTEIE